MRLSQLKLHNYRRFEDFEIDFHPELTVIAARNGQGKTTILEAIVAAFGPFAGAFDMGKSKHIERTDARYSRVGKGYEHEQNFPVTIDARQSAPLLEWQRALLSAKGRTTTKEAAPLANWGKELQVSLRTNSEVELPVIAYYSTARLWVAHKNLTRKTVLTASRTMGYEDCLSSASNFVQLQQWMGKATLATLQQKDVPGYEQSDLGPRLQGICAAVDQVLRHEGWSRFHYSVALEELAMDHPDHGLLPVSLLSDGVRAMIALTADLAFRCARLNGQFAEQAPTRTKGIALIDEVDLHLHPAWQQRVIGQLREAFPHVQFIVTTHSPQVLTTVPSECIRILRDNKAYAAPAGTEGAEPQRLLQQVLGLEDLRPPANLATQELREYLSLVDRDQWNSPHALELRHKLDARYLGQEPALLDADLQIENRKWELGQ